MAIRILFPLLLVEHHRLSVVAPTMAALSLSLDGDSQLFARVPFAVHKDIDTAQVRAYAGLG